MERHPAFVLGSFIGALGIVRSLGSRGVPCWICAPKRQVADRSRYARFWQIPEPRDGRAEAEILTRLKQLAEKTGGRPVVFPADDNFARVLARLAPKMGDDFALCTAPPEVVEWVNDKAQMAAWGKAQGLPCLETVKASELSEPSQFPAVIKPVNKFYFQYSARNLPDGSQAMDFSFTLVEDRAAWLRFRERLRDDLDQFVVQEYVPGTTAEMWSVGLYADRASQVLATFVLKKIRGYPAQYGETKAGQNDRVPPALLDRLRHAVSASGLRGIVEFEFRCDAATGEFKLLDINPRAWTWIGITNASPADIPWVAYQDLCGIPQQPVSETRPPGSVKFVFLLSDFLSVVYRYRRDYPPWVMSPLAWWRSLKAERLVVAEFHQRDWQAGLFFALSILKSVARRISEKRSTRSSSDGESLAENRERTSP